MHQSILAPIIRISNLTLYNEMRSVFAVTQFGGIGYKISEESVGATSTVWITMAIDYGHHVAHFAHGDDVGRQEIESI